LFDLIPSPVKQKKVLTSPQPSPNQEREQKIRQHFLCRLPSSPLLLLGEDLGEVSNGIFLVSEEDLGEVTME